MKLQLFTHWRAWSLHFGRWSRSWDIGQTLDWQLTIGPFTLRHRR